MPGLIEVSRNTFVNPIAVTAVQGRLVNELTGTVTITTAGGSVLVQSTDVVAELERIVKLLNDSNTVTISDSFGNQIAAQPPVVNVTNISSPTA